MDETTTIPLSCPICAAITQVDPATFKQQPRAGCGCGLVLHKERDGDLPWYWLGARCVNCRLELSSVPVRGLLEECPYCGARLWELGL